MAERLPTNPCLPGRTRLPFIDAAKGIGILLVVLGHSPGLPPFGVVLIYSFHMPLFFFISGFVQTATRSATPPGEVIRRNVRSLLVPYLFFFAVSLAYWMATRGMGVRASKFAGIGIVDALKGLVTGLSSDLFVNPALWFLPCLFACASVNVLLRRRVGARAVMAGAVAIVAIWTFAGGWQTRLPWNLDIAWMALVFYSAGDALRDSRWSIASWTTRTLLIAFPFVLFAWALAAWRLGRVDMAHALFGRSLWLYMASGFLGTGVVLLISRFVPENAFVRWLADQSLTIFGLHALLINLACGALKFMQVGSDDGDAALWSLALFAWAIAISLAASMLLSRHFPLLLGRRLLKETR
jgi:acyltransferase